MQQITALIVAKDEADRIAKTIASVIDICAEVLVVDTGSTDQTIQISENAGARVVSAPWLGYGPTKNHGATLAKYPWILSLDADEVVDKAQQQAIAKLTLSADNVYLLNRLVHYQGQWIRHSGYHPDWVYRLYHKDHCQWNDSKVHEKLIYDNCKQVQVAGFLEHYSFRSAAHFREKTEEYARLTAEQWIATGKSPSLWKRLFGPWYKYVQTYYLYQGYKDGPVGKQIAKIKADGVRQKIAFFNNLTRAAT